MLSGMFGGGERKNEGGNNALIGIVFMAFSWVLTLFTLYLSRLREYYADSHSVAVVENGAEKLSTGLVTIVEESQHASKQNKEQKKSNTAFKALFISDPDRAALIPQNYTQCMYKQKRPTKRNTHKRTTLLTSSLKSSQPTQT